MKKKVVRTKKDAGVTSQSTGLIAVLLIAAIGIGGLLGYFLSGLAPVFQVIGNIYLSLLAALTFGLILTSIVTGLSVIGDHRKLWRLVGKSGLYFLVIGLVAIGIGAIVSLTVAPQADLTAVTITNQLQSTQPVLDTEFQDRFYATGLLSSMFSGQYLYIILFAILLGSALISVTKKSALVLNFFSESNSVLTKLTAFMLRLAPIGLMAVVGSNVGRDGLSFLGGGSGSLLLSVLLATVLYGVIFLSLTLVFLGRKPLGSFSSGIGPALLTAFATSSSSKNLAFTYEAVTTRAGIDERAGSTVPALGTILNFGATAMFAIITAGYLVHSGSIELSILQWLGIGLCVALLSIGTAGMPLVGTAALVVIFGAIGLGDLTAVAGFATVLLAEVILIDRLRATLNVWGDAVGAAVIGQTFDLKTVRARTRTVSKRATTTRTGRGDRERRGDRPDTRPGRPVERRDRNGHKSPASAPTTTRGRRTTRTDSRTQPKTPAKRKSRAEESSAPSPFAIDSNLPASGLEIESGTMPTIPPTSESPSSTPAQTRTSSRTTERRPSSRPPRESTRRQQTKSTPQLDVLDQSDKAPEPTKPEPRRPVVKIARRVPRIEKTKLPAIEETPPVIDQVEPAPKDVVSSPEKTPPPIPLPEPETPVADAIPEPEAPAPEPETTPEPEAPPVVYGRSRVRKGAALKAKLDKKADEPPAEKKEEAVETPPAKAETPVENTTVDDSAVDNAPAEEAPVETTAVDDSPVDDTPTEEAPAEKMTFGRGKRKRIR